MAKKTEQTGVAIFDTPDGSAVGIFDAPTSGTIQTKDGIAITDIGLNYVSFKIEETPDTTFRMRIDTKLYRQAQEFAKKDHRTFRNLVEMLLDRHMNGGKDSIQ